MIKYKGELYNIKEKVKYFQEKGFQIEPNKGQPNIIEVTYHGNYAGKVTYHINYERFLCFEYCESVKIHRLGIELPYRDQGLGTLLVAIAMEQAEKYKAKKVTTFPSACDYGYSLDQQQLIEFYQRFTYSWNDKKIQFI